MFKILFNICIIAIVFIISGCDNGKSKVFEPFCKKIQSSISPVALQQWAKPLVCKEFELDQVSSDIWPECIKKMGADGPATCFKGEWANAKGDALIFLWGSGFRHWGIIAGDEKFRIENSDPAMYVEEWIPGVYFFIDM